MHDCQCVYTILTPLGNLLSIQISTKHSQRFACPLTILPCPMASARADTILRKTKRNIHQNMHISPRKIIHTIHHIYTRILSYIQRGNIQIQLDSGYTVQPRFWTIHRPRNTVIASRSGSKFGCNFANDNGQGRIFLERVWSVCTCASSWVVANLVGASGKSGVHSLPGTNWQLLQCLHGTFDGWCETFSRLLFERSRSCMKSHA